MFAALSVWSLGVAMTAAAGLAVAPAGLSGPPVGALGAPPVLAVGPTDSVAAPGTPWLAQDPEGVGLGVIVGLPVGITASWRGEGPLWYAADLGYSAETATVALDADANLELVRPSAYRNADWQFPVHVGLGARIRGGQGALAEGLNRAVFGLRVPVGISVQHDGFPAEVFAQVAPGLGLSPRVVGTFDLGFGLRLYLPHKG